MYRGENNRTRSPLLGSIYIYICKHIKEANLDIILHCGVLSFFLTILNSMERKWWS